MTIEMQRLLTKEIMEELSNIDRILNRDCCKVNDETADKLLSVHKILVE